jgi:uncharacterized Zn finger protein
MNAFPSRPDSRLRSFVADEYHRRKRHEEAMALMWVEFRDRPGLETYKVLKSHADRAGRWDLWREKALAHLRETIEKGKRKHPNSPWGWPAFMTDHSELVRIFLWEKDVEAAWREANAGGCAAQLWLDLAGKREKDFPEDALRIYQQRIAPIVNVKNDQAYREGVALLRKVRALMVRLGREASFGRYLDEVRAEHKPKRNFMKLLDHATWQQATKRSKRGWRFEDEPVPVGDSCEKYGSSQT